MEGITDIEVLLQSMNPELSNDEYVFTTISEKEKMPDITLATAMFREREGITLIFPKQHVPSIISRIIGNFRMITLTVHSSLDAVGLTAAIAKALADENISANVVAAYYHDHVFIPTEKANDAMAVLARLQRNVSKKN